MKITVVCDRCKREIQGVETELCTAGFYRTTPGTDWRKYANLEEEKVCDNCMWQDPRYIADYGRPLRSS